MTTSESPESIDPEDAFTALADETRLAIIQALWNPGGGWGSRGAALSFSDLREAVGVRDSGQFNYHLDKLRDRFVRKTEEGYALTLAGRKINGAILSGSYTMAGEIEPIDLDDPCPACGAPMTFDYNGGRILIDCGECGMQLSAGVPPGVFEGVERADFPDVATRYLRAQVSKIRRGFCWFCEGRVDAELVAVRDLLPPDEDDPDVAPDLPFARYTCRRCAASLTNDLGTALLEEPRVAVFHDDHGVDVTGATWWHHGVMDEDVASFADEAETRASVFYQEEDEQLRVVVDDALEVCETERLPLEN